MSAYILLAEGSSWVSSLIKKESGSKFSHCAFAFTDTGLTYEADAGGGQIRGLATYPWPHTFFAVEGLTGVVHQEIALREWCTSKVGVRYDYGKVIGMWIDRWMIRLGFPLYLAGFRRILDHRAALQCVEYVYEGLRALPEPLLLSPHALTSPPGDLEREPLLEAIMVEDRPFAKEYP